MSTPAAANKVGVILSSSDLSAMFVAYMQNFLVGSGYAGSGIMPGFQALLISAISRGVTSYIAGTAVPMSDMVISGDASNIILVAIANAVIAFLRGQKVVKQALLGAEIDSLSYNILQSIPKYPGGDVPIIEF